MKHKFFVQIKLLYYMLWAYAAYTKLSEIFVLLVFLLLGHYLKDLSHRL